MATGGWRSQGPTPMRALIVVVQAVLMQLRFEMSLIHDQHPVQAFAATASHPPLRVRVRHRRHQRSHDDPSAFRLEDAVSPGSELPVAIVNHEPQLDSL